MKSKEPGTIRQLFAFVGENNGKMLLSIFLAVLGELFGMGPFLMVAVLADALYRGTATPTLVLFLCGGAAVCQIIKMLLTWRSSLMSHKISFTILKNIREAITDRMAKVPMGVMLETPTGAFKNLIVDNVAKLEDSMAHFMPELPSNIAAPLCSILLIFLLDWRMGLAALVTIPLGTLFFAAMMRGYGPRMENYMRSANEMNSALVEYVNGIQVIKAFNRSAASYCLTFLFCAFTVYSDLETMGNSAFLSKKINTELDRLEEVTDIPKMDASSEKLVVSHYDISLEHISFGYGDRRVIHDISLEIPEHTTCAIVGPSGSGKTTLCNLIARFWDVQEGTVRIGGKDVRDYTADSVLEYISMVFQNVYLFHDSVENNIRFGRPEATHEQVVAAAKRACCHDFILSLPEGYDTIIGEGGSTLSGGEKQRISIARAILKDAPIIILDEATSSVDPENEQALLSAIQELTKDKTLISIAHRLSTVRNADQIIVIDQGRVVQQGKHNELLQKDGIYRKFLSLRTRATGWHL